MLKLTKELDQLLTSLILPCVERVDPAVRNAAFEALGSLCTCDLELAQQRLLLFVQAVQMDHTVLQVTTAKVLFDLVQLFGLSVSITFLFKVMENYIFKSFNDAYELGKEL